MASSNFTIPSYSSSNFTIPSPSPIITEFKTAICATFFDLPRAERGRVSGWFVAGALLLAAAVALAVHCCHRRAAARARHLGDERRDEEAAAAAAAQAAATAEARVAQLEVHLAASQARAAALEREVGLLASAAAAAERRRREIYERLAVVEEARKAEADISKTSCALYEKAKEEVQRLRGLLAAMGRPSAAVTTPPLGARSEPSEPSAEAEASETPGTLAQRGGRTAEGAGALPGEAPATATEAEVPEDSEYFSATSYT